MERKCNCSIIIYSSNIFESWTKHQENNIENRIDYKYNVGLYDEMYFKLVCI